MGPVLEEVVMGRGGHRQTCKTVPRGGPAAQEQSRALSGRERLPPRCVRRELQIIAPQGDTARTRAPACHSVAWGDPAV